MTLSEQCWNVRSQAPAGEQQRPRSTPSARSESDALSGEEWDPDLVSIAPVRPIKRARIDALRTHFRRKTVSHPAHGWKLLRWMTW